MTTELEKYNTSTHYPQESKIAWQHPTIERIDIKRTLNGAGSFLDLTGLPSSFAP